MSHYDLVEAAKAAINEVFGDESVEQTQTGESLRELKDEIDVLINALEDDGEP